VEIETKGPSLLIVGLGNPGLTYKETRHNIGFKVVEEFCSAISSNKVSSTWFRTAINIPSLNDFFKVSSSGVPYEFTSFKPRLVQYQKDLANFVPHECSVFVIKPLTYMNKSGDAVANCSAYYKIHPERVLVVHDDIDLMFGDLRVKVGGGHGGHNGLKSMMERLGTPNFSRVRFGVGRPEFYAHSEFHASDTATKSEPSIKHDEVANWVLSSFPKTQSKRLADLVDIAVDTLLQIVALNLGVIKPKETLMDRSTSSNLKTNTVSQARRPGAHSSTALSSSGSRSQTILKQAQLSTIQNDINLQLKRIAQ
jgi:peptidyl-tRNA hydrolase, PTH1 family